MLFLPFLLFQVKSALLFRFALLFADVFSVQLVFFPLKLQRLLRLCSDTGTSTLLAHCPLNALGIGHFRFERHINGRTEFEPAVIFQNERPNLTVTRFCAESDLAHRQPSALYPLEHTDRTGPQKTQSVFRCFLSSRHPPEIMIYRNGQPGGAGYLPEQQFRRPGYLPALARTSVRCVFILRVLMI